MEAVLADGVLAVLLWGPHPPKRVVGVECNICTRHIVLWGVHELRPWGRDWAAREMAGVSCDNRGGGGEQVHGGPVHLWVVVAAFHRGGVLGWPNNLNNINDNENNIS